MKEHGISHIHAPWATYPSTAAMFCSRLAGYSFSFTARAHDLFLEDHGLELKLREAHFSQTITEYNRSLIQKRYLRSGADSLHVIHSSLDPDDFADGSEPVSPALLLSVGRLVEMKGFRDLIEACALMRDRGLSFQCSIAGHGPLQEELEKLIEQRGLSGRVGLLGAVSQSEIRRLLTQATCFVLPCVTAADGDQDGIPNALMEAMAARVPVISCPTSGVPELVLDEKTGLMAEPRNPYSLSCQIERMLLQPELRERLVREAWLKVDDEFNIRKNAARLAGLFPVPNN